MTQEQINQSLKVLTELRESYRGSSDDEAIMLIGSKIKEYLRMVPTKNTEVKCKYERKQTFFGDFFRTDLD